MHISALTNARVREERLLTNARAPRQKADLAISKKEGMQALKALGTAQTTFAKWQVAVNL